MTTALGVVRDEDPETRNEAAARRLRGKFAELRISASAVAREIGMTQAAISRRMLGKTEFTLTEIDAICEATGISYEYVVLGRDSKNPHPGGPDGGIHNLRARRDSNSQPSDLCSEVRLPGQIHRLWVSHEVPHEVPAVAA
jgi:transcriptional regulator with XRE-family HTH domain